jgi:hypothetical protein
MRRALTCLALLVAWAGVVFAAPVLHLSGWKATAGKPEIFTITRIGGNGVATVIFTTGAAGDTAQPGVDYTATSQTISWQKGETSATVTVPTFVNPAKAGTNIQFTATITSGSSSSSAQGLIMEPPPPSLTQSCWDGSVIAASSACPPKWVSAPLVDGGYARCKTAAGCHSISYPCPQGLNPPAACSYPDIIAQQGDVGMYKWNGIMNNGRVIAALWPIGQYMTSTPGVGGEGWAEEWEGVAPAPGFTPAP